MGINRHHFVDILPVTVWGYVEAIQESRGYVQTNSCSYVLKERC